MHIAIQGQAGSFHDQAAQQWYGPDAEIIPCTTFSEVFAAYDDGSADAIITAVENTLFGSINEVYRYIEECDAPIVGEIKLPVEQMLVGLPGAKISDITEVYSHPVALSQCRRFLQKRLSQATPIEFFDTAGAVEFIKQNGSRHCAAIAGQMAAGLYDLPILEESIHDNPDNITRFLVIEPTDRPVDANRASLVITTDHQPGALVEVLQIFAKRRINLAKLQSQPIVGQPWKYKFFVVVDCAGQTLYQAIRDIERSNHEVTVLGEYVGA